MYARLLDPARWTDDWYATTANGQWCEPNHKDAACWCVVGAIEKEAETYPVAYETRRHLLAYVKEHRGIKDLPGFNGASSHAQLLATIAGARTHVALGAGLPA